MRTAPTPSVKGASAAGRAPAAKAFSQALRDGASSVRVLGQPAEPQKPQWRMNLQALSALARGGPLKKLFSEVQTSGRYTVRPLSAEQAQKLGHDGLTERPLVPAPM